MRKASDEDRRFALRLGNVLKQLRRTAQLVEPGKWTQEKAAETIDVPASTLGKWERGEHAPKGYDLGRLYRAYERFGAEWGWFFDPPEVVTVNPVRDRLDALRDARQREAGALSREDFAAEQAVHRAAASRRSARRRTRPA